mmetsp:Transcript_1678/g.5470  ORF Transcript_1678/g.5470 Transcript_1678/m.5470 type:complete len:272 (-) Transcript_1678:1404-2219(-)
MNPQCSPSVRQLPLKIISPLKSRASILYSGYPTRAISAVTSAASCTSMWQVARLHSREAIASLEGARMSSITGVDKSCPKVSPSLMKASVAGWVDCIRGVRSSTYVKWVSAAAKGTATRRRSSAIDLAEPCENRPSAAHRLSLRCIAAANAFTAGSVSPIDTPRAGPPNQVPSRVSPSRRFEVKKRGRVSRSDGVSDSETSTDWRTAVAAPAAMEVMVEVGRTSIEVKHRARVAPETMMVWPCVASAISSAVVIGRPLARSSLNLVSRKSE